MGEQDKDAKGPGSGSRAREQAANAGKDTMRSLTNPDSGAGSHDESSRSSVTDAARSDAKTARASDRSVRDASDESDDDDDNRPTVTRGQAIFRMTVTTFALLFVLEILVRLVFWFRESRANARYEAFYPPHTYVADFAPLQDYRFINLYTINPEKGRTPEYTFDARGFRLDKRNLRFDDPPGKTKRIWMFGGSTTQGDGTRANETIASYLNDRFEKDGSDWRVLNLGQGGYTTSMEVLLLLELIHAGHKPDAILCYDGINDSSFDGDIDQLGSPGWEKGTPKGRLMLDIQGGRSLSSLLALTISRMTKLDDLMASLAGRMARSAGASKGAETSTDRGGQAHPGDNWDVVARRYLTNHLVIKSMADDVLHVPSFHFFQPVMQYEDHYKLRALAPLEESALVPEMNRNEWKRHEAVFSAKNADLRAGLGERFVDIHDTFKGQNGVLLYADPRHPNGRGAELVADRLYATLKQRLAAPAGVPSSPTPSPPTPTP